MVRPILLGALLLLGCAPAPRVAPVATPLAGPTVAFVDVDVVPMDADHVLHGQTVVVTGDTIVAVGDSATVSVPRGARVIQGKGQTLLPGLADMHAHLRYQEDLALYLARGVTTVRNMWGGPMHLDWRARIARGELAGPAIVTAGPIVDGERPVHDGSLIVRTEEEAERAVALHQQAGYDFIKVYSAITPPAYERLLTAAAAAGLAVEGHVPRAVGLVRAVELGQRSIEHLDAFTEALQADDSPVAGKFDRASRQKKIDHVDESKIPALVEKIRDAGAWVCPTRVVLAGDEPPEALAARLARPEAKLMPGHELAIWRSGGPASDGDRRALLLADKLLRALHEGGVKLVVGTDTGNSWVIPGYAVHEELGYFVAAGMTPYQALRAATALPAALLGVADKQGTIAVGRRADLLLVDGNPLVDVAAAGRIAGVMARGRWLDAHDLDGMLAGVAAFAQGQRDVFAGLPALPSADGERAAYEIGWNEARFGGERIAIDGKGAIVAQITDPHEAESFTVRLDAGGLTLDGDGATGRGHLQVAPAGGRLVGAGTLLSGAPAALDAPLPAGAVMVPGKLMAAKLVLRPQLLALAIGGELEAHVVEIALGSSAEATPATWKIKRTTDEAGLRRFELRTGGGKPEVLVLDARGWPVSYDIPAFGSTVSYRRLAN